jgi:hypothetical protein
MLAVVGAPADKHATTGPTVHVGTIRVDDYFGRRDGLLKVFLAQNYP